MTYPMFTFNNGLPFGTHAPSVDQPGMLTNNQSDTSIWAADHFGYNVGSSGKHLQMTIPNRTTYNGTGISPIPPSVIANFGGLYCDNGSSTTPLNETCLWYTPDNTGNTYQLTRTISASFSLFGKFTNNYNTAGTDRTGGWTFLPGGLLFQYGFLSKPSGLGTDGSIEFPVQFNTTNIVVNLTLIAASTGVTTERTLSVVTEAEDHFSWNLTSGSSNYVGINWQAIGI